MALDSYGAIVLSAIKSDVSISPGRGTRSPAPQTGVPNDTLVVYLEPDNVLPHIGESPAEAELAVKKLWARLLRIYRGTQAENPTDDQLNRFETGDKFQGIPRSIELRTAPVDIDKAREYLPANDSTTMPSYVTYHSKITDYCPLMRTHSAIGVLRSVTQTDRRVEFVKPADVENEPWGRPSFADCYTVVEPGKDQSREKTRTITPRISGRDYSQNLNFNFTPEQMESERALAQSRRYLLIIVSDKAPSSAFVCAQLDIPVREPGKDPVLKKRYFYIDYRDFISQKNFAFISQIMTIQASPSPPALTPSLTVGGKD